MLHFMGKDLLSFADMKRQAHGLAKTWLGLDRSFCLELSFLNEIADGVGQGIASACGIGRVAH